MNSSNSSITFAGSADDQFGPAFGGQGRSFDFTLLFEDSILVIAPSALFLTAACVRGFALYGSPARVRFSNSQLFKTAFVSAFAVLQLTVLLVWATNPASGSKATIPAASLDFIAACILCLLSAYEHTRTVAPSSIIGLYLLISLPFDVARLRTLFFLETLSTRSVATISTLSTLVKVGVIILEAANKRKILLARYQWLPPEATSGVYSRSVFWWLNDLLRTGFLHILRVEDLHAVDETLRSTNVSLNFHGAWSKTKQSRQYALLAATWSALKWSLIVSGMPRLLLIGLRYAQPFLIQRTINYVADRENQLSSVGWGLVAAYALTYVGQALLTAAYNHLLNRCIVQIRGGLVSLIYSKTIDLSITALDESAALTLMSTDVQTIADSLIWLHDSWGSAIEVGIAIYLLYRALGAATIAPGMVFLCAMIAMGALTRIFPRLQKKWIQAIQIRVSFTATMLGSMRSIKLLGISNVARGLTQGLRTQEIAVSTHLRKASMLRVIMQNSSSIFAPFVTFAVFVAQANKTDQPLNTAAAFNVLSILQLLESPIGQLVRTLPILVASVSCFARIQDFLLSRSRQDHRMTIGRTSRNGLYQASSAQSEEGIEMTSNMSVSHMLTDDAMVLQSCSFGWSSDKTVLHDIDLRFKTSSITMVIGPVGCGKSTLIKGMLGETPSSAGFVYTSTSSIAFADQEPWSQNSTIRESVRAESSHDDLFYQQVVESCGLLQDLCDLPNGDSTIIGSKGISLSGGQKQRLALARAVYARKDILVLDDVFSGLDADTEEHIFRKLFSKTGLLRRSKTTVVLVTHAVHRLPYADHIVALGADGRIFEQGKYDSLRQSGGYVQGLAIQHRGSGVATDEQGTATGTEPARRPTQPNDGTDEASDMSRKTGDWQTYKQYFAAAGWWASTASILWCLVAMLALKSPGLLVTYFTGDAVTGSSTNTIFLILFGIMSLTAALSLLAGCGTVFLRLIPKASSGLHSTLLDTVMHAPLSFFTTTDSGTTLNRFSQDMSLIDLDLPDSFLDFVFSLMAVIVIGALMSASATYFLAAVPVAVLALYAIQKYYLRTSRQMRFLDLEAKAPLYSHFQETLGGLASIRAFGWVDQFTQQNLELLDQSQRPFYLMFCIQRWLAVVLDLLVAGLATVLMVIVVSLRRKIDPALVGLGLLNVMTFNFYLTLLVQMWTQMETSVGAIARLRDFVKTTDNERQKEENLEPPEEWPHQGALEISHFAASYSTLPTSNIVLNDINLDIRPGEKFGICGRSGSGKSSLLASLFHLLEYRDGAINIDGHNLAFIRRDTLRQRLNVIPQDPYWISTKSVRFNMDPWCDLTSSIQEDTRFIEALVKCQVWHIIEAKGGLDATMDQEFLSHGQRQLFCLARAILRKSKVVVLDEVSASVDIHTDALMQSIIRAEFKDCTIISVAHRLNTIADFDRIAVLSAGRIVECDAPQTLLNRQGSKFRELYEM